MPLSHMPVIRSPSGREASKVEKKPFDVPRRRNGRLGAVPPGLVCHCCSSTVLMAAPVIFMLTRVLANDWTLAACL